MIDYADIGSRIRAVRLERKMAQEQLANAVHLGVTHLSHSFWIYGSCLWRRNEDHHRCKHIDRDHI